jgi:hypothetical protein
MESNDLNKLRRRTPDEQKPTVEQQIAALHAEIGDLERAVVEAPSELSAFLALAPAAQVERLKVMNTSLPKDAQYSMDEYLTELRNADAEPSLARLRLAVSKAKLDQLLKASKS